MNIFKRFSSERDPTKEEKADALAFKNKLKYGEDLDGMYAAARKLIHDGIDQEEYVKGQLAERYKFKKREIYDNWTSFRIATHSDCHKSPIRKCLFVSHFGDKSPEKDDPIYCLCCKEKLF